ncbi:MAG: competence/damage-inducible protein A [Oscillospiraceae bacterium]|jgi:nicotinamide-nucleotide amidase|nr:competence/damage-inducible protein A [Oscillospiraceae bacterium]
MTAELIAVGTELLLGGTANTDAQVVSQALSSLGVNVYYHTVVGDNAGRVKAAVELARTRSDIVITTGGLGPTYDDMTKAAVAEAFGLKLELFPEEARRVREWFADSGYPFTENNLNQAYFPEGATILENGRGTAPGCAFEKGGVHCIMLPGPPRECGPMVQSGLVPYIKALRPGLEIVSHNIHIFGLGESAVEDKLRDYMEGLTNPTLAPYAKTGEVQLRVTAKAQTHAEAEELMKPVIAHVREVLGDIVYGIDCDTLENRVFELLLENRKTVATAESVTGGLIAKRLTDIPGASRVFSGSIVAYNNGIKQKLLGVRPKTLETHGAVSRETAKEMAVGALARFATDYAVATTGFAGTPEDAGGDTAFIALATDGSLNVQVREFKAGYDRERTRVMAAHIAFDMIRRELTIKS